MKLSPQCSLDTVHRPGTTVGRKVFCLSGMPVATFVDRRVLFQELIDELVERWYYLISMGHGESTSRAEVVLHINHNQSSFTVIQDASPWSEFFLDCSLGQGIANCQIPDCQLEWRPRKQRGLRTSLGRIANCQLLIVN